MPTRSLQLSIRSPSLRCPTSSTWKRRRVTARLSVGLISEDNNDAPSSNRPAGGSRRRYRNRSHRCLLRHVHLSSGGASSIAGGVMEQRLVSALFLCGDQLYEQLGIRLLRRRRLMDWSVRLYQLDESTYASDLEPTDEESRSRFLFGQSARQNALDSGADESDSTGQRCSNSKAPPPG